MTELESLERLAKIRKCLLAVKFSDKDNIVLQKRLKSSNIKRLDGKVIKGRMQGLALNSFKDHVISKLKPDLYLSDDNVQHLLDLCNDSTNSDSVLEEINPHKKLFGYVVAAKTPDQVFDIIHVAFEANCELKTSCCTCFTADRQR